MRRKQAFMLIEPFGVAHGKLPAVRKRERPAFMLIELLVLIAVIAVLVPTLVSVMRSSIAESHRTVCATKLSTIADSFAKYDDDTDYGGFPRLAAKGNPDDLPRDGNALDTATLGTNTMQNMWMLMDGGFLPASHFGCPADRDYLPRSAQTRYGWENYNQFSYGMQNPYDADSETSTKTNAASPAEDSYKANQIFFADMNPGGAVDGSTITHSNHPNGCNVVTRNGNVWFHNGKRSSVMYGEEIYDDDGDPSDAWPDSSTDVVITPTHSKGNRKTVTRLPEGTVPIALMVGLAVAVAIVLVVVVARYRKPKLERP